MIDTLRRVPLLVETLTFEREDRTYSKQRRRAKDEKEKEEEPYLVITKITLDVVL